MFKFVFKGFSFIFSKIQSLCEFVFWVIQAKIFSLGLSIGVSGTLAGEEELIGGGLINSRIRIRITLFIHGFSIS